MTHNQINYVTYQENMRHNLAQEAETHRANVINEQLTRNAQVLQAQSNAIALQRNEETARHNSITEVLTAQNQAEVNRHNTEAEAEQTRHNRESEQAQRDSNVLSGERNAETKRNNIWNNIASIFTTGANAASRIWSGFGSFENSFYGA